MSQSFAQSASRDNSGTTSVNASAREGLVRPPRADGGSSRGSIAASRDNSGGSRVNSTARGGPLRPPRPDGGSSTGSIAAGRRRQQASPPPVGGLPNLPTAASPRRRPWQEDVVSNPVGASLAGNGCARSLSAPLVPSQIQVLRTRCIIAPGKDGSAEEDVCAVCLEALNPSKTERCVRLPCGAGHVFHLCCVEPWFKKCSLCPKCRQPLQVKVPQARARSNHGSGRMTYIDREVMMSNMQYASLEEEMRAMGQGVGNSTELQRFESRRGGWWD